MLNVLDSYLAVPTKSQDEVIGWTYNSCQCDTGLGLIDESGSSSRSEKSNNFAVGENEKTRLRSGVIAYNYTNSLSVKTCVLFVFVQLVTSRKEDAAPRQTGPGTPAA